MLGAPALLDLKEFSEQAAHYAPKLALAVLLLAAGALFTRAVRAATRLALRRATMRPSTRDLAVRIAGGAGWVLVLSIVLSTLQLQTIVLGLSGVLALMSAAFVSSASATSNDIIAASSSPRTATSRSATACRRRACKASCARSTSARRVSWTTPGTCT